MKSLFIALACTANVFAQGTTPTTQETGASPASAISAIAGNPPAAPQPGIAEAQAAMQRTLGYDSGLSWEILAVRPSGISGLSDIIVSINKQPSQHIYFSVDSQNAIVGSMIPFGPDPFAAARAKLEAADGPSRGAKNPAINIVEFCDLESPHGKATQPILEKLLADFPKTRWTFQQFPLPATLHPWAMRASLYADCAGRMDSESYWKFVDSVFENQGQITGANVDDKLKLLAQAAGLDAEKLATSASTPETAASVKKSLALGASLDVNESPTIFINGRRVLAMASIPYDQLKKLVQFEIDHAGK